MPASRSRAFPRACVAPSLGSAPRSPRPAAHGRRKLHSFPKPPPEPGAAACSGVSPRPSRGPRQTVPAGEAGDRVQPDRPGVTTLATPREQASDAGKRDAVAAAVPQPPVGRGNPPLCPVAGAQQDAGEPQVTVLCDSTGEIGRRVHREHSADGLQLASSLLTFFDVHDAEVGLVEPAELEGAEVDGPDAISHLLEANEVPAEQATHEDLPVSPTDG